MITLYKILYIILYIPHNRWPGSGWTRRKMGCGWGCCRFAGLASAGGSAGRFCLRRKRSPGKVGARAWASTPHRIIWLPGACIQPAAIPCRRWVLAPPQTGWNAWAAHSAKNCNLCPISAMYATEKHCPPGRCFLAIGTKWTLFWIVFACQKHQKMTARNGRLFLRQQ